jgi:hypothetical protein
MSAQIIPMFALVEVDPDPCTIPPFPEDIRPDGHFHLAGPRGRLGQPDPGADRAAVAIGEAR